MENPIQNTAGDNGGTAGTKLERLQLRARRLQQQAQQARERLREEESAQEKLARLLERRRIESEQRLLGGLAYIAGLSSFRMRSAGTTSNDIPTARCRSSHWRDATVVRAAREP